MSLRNTSASLARSSPATSMPCSSTKTRCTRPGVKVRQRKGVSGSTRSCVYASKRSTSQSANCKPAPSTFSPKRFISRILRMQPAMASSPRAASAAVSRPLRCSSVTAAGVCRAGLRASTCFLAALSRSLRAASRSAVMLWAWWSVAHLTMSLVIAVVPGSGASFSSRPRPSFFPSMRTQPWGAFSTMKPSLASQPAVQSSFDRAVARWAFVNLSPTLGLPYRLASDFTEATPFSSQKYCSSRPSEAIASPLSCSHGLPSTVAGRPVTNWPSFSVPAMDAWVSAELRTASSLCTTS
mmetsp:Transcript_77752/g.251637  ORF Transcript_77752/g.251637 Transcript_77752/m.251637 type:complete len:296 (+) Transcript_77752:2148-3035(+)